MRDLYQETAPRYDRRLGIALIKPVRRMAVEALGLRGGETVVDVACGTGANFDALLRRVGPLGRLVGVDASDDMLARARERMGRHPWTNVELVHAPVQAADLPLADAALVSFSHDVMHSMAAVRRIAGALRPGGRLVACGIMEPWWPFAPGRPLVHRAAAPYVTDFADLDRPWRAVETVLEIRKLRRLARFAGAMCVVGAQRR